MIGDDFRPEVGFVRRRDMARSLGRVRFSPRLLSVPAIRKLSWSGGIDYIENGRGILETREADAEFGIEFENSDQLAVRYARTFEQLLEPFSITSEISIPTGGYDFETVRAELVLGAQRVASGRFRLEHGTFFSGHKTELAVSRGRLQLSRRISTEPTYAFSLVDLAQGRFTTHLRRLARHVHRHAADVHQRAHPVQLVEQHRGRQHPLPLGVSAGQRTVRRLQRAAQHAGADAAAGAHPEPRGRGEADPAVPLLTPAAASTDAAWGWGSGGEISRSATIGGRRSA